MVRGNVWEAFPSLRSVDPTRGPTCTLDEVAEILDYGHAIDTARAEARRVINHVHRMRSSSLKRGVTSSFAGTGRLAIADRYVADWEHPWNELRKRNMVPGTAFLYDMARNELERVRPLLFALALDEIGVPSQLAKEIFIANKGGSTSYTTFTVRGKVPDWMLNLPRNGWMHSLADVYFDAPLEDSVQNIFLVANEAVKSVWSEAEAYDANLQTRNLRDELMQARRKRPIAEPLAQHLGEVQSKLAEASALIAEHGIADALRAFGCSVNISLITEVQVRLHHWPEYAQRYIEDYDENVDKVKRMVDE